MIKLIKKIEIEFIYFYMINFIGYISYLTSMGILLLLFPSSFIKKGYENNE